MPRPVILRVDDERTVLTGLEEQLRRRFGRECIVELAESGEDALEVIDELVENGDDLAVVVSEAMVSEI
jgi:CheY-like chemotaxis protein